MGVVHARETLCGDGTFSVRCPRSKWFIFIRILVCSNVPVFKVNTSIKIYYALVVEGHGMIYIFSYQREFGDGFFFFLSDAIKVDSDKRKSSVSFFK